MKVKSLLIVYKDKDEEFFKQLKELIITKDDEVGNTIGVEDGSVRPIKCSEKKWLEHKESGRDDRLLGEKIIFIDDIKDVVLSNPVYNKYGISYGPIDNRHYAIVVDEKYIWNEHDYTSFQLELKQLTDNSSISEQDAFAGQEGAKKKIKQKGKFVALSLSLRRLLLQVEWLQKMHLKLERIQNLFAAKCSTLQLLRFIWKNWIGS